jgi:hypothetical protein
VAGGTPRAPAKTSAHPDFANVSEAAQATGATVSA